MIKVKVSILVSLLGLVLQSIVYAQEEAPLCVIKSIAGYLYLKPKGSKTLKEEEKYRLAKIGEFLYPGDKLRTKENSFAELVFFDGTTFWLNENTEIILKKKESKVKKGIFYIFLDMLFGRVRSKVPEGNEFELNTPSAIVAVKGTDFDVEADEKKTVVIVFEGIIEIMNRWGEMLVETSQICTTLLQQAPQTPQKIDTKKIKDWREKLGEACSLKLFTQNTKVIPHQIIEMELFVVDDKGKKYTLEEEIEVFLYTEPEDSAELSLDTSVWYNALKVKLKGSIKFYLKIGEDVSDKLTLIATAAELKPTTLTFDILRKEVIPKEEEKSIIIKLKDNAGIEREIILRYQKK